MLQRMRRRVQRDLSSGLTSAEAVLAALVALVLLVSVPSLTHSSFANMGYWVDWANLLAIALGLGAVAAVFFWPLLALLKGPARRV